jgi:hypothetical protein
MKTAKELFEILKTDEAFAKEFSEALTAKREAGAKSYYETIIPAAEERGYELSKEELDEILKAQDSELSAEELGKVAGGGSCVTLVIGTIMITIGTYTLYDELTD